MSCSEGMAGGFNSLITDSMVEEARKLVGVPLRRYLFNTQASRIAIARFARGIGDRNPLWLGEEYGRGTVWGSMLAPPAWLYSVDSTFVAPKFPGVPAIYCGTDWEFFRPVHLDDSINVEAKLVDVIRKEGRFCGGMVLQVGEVLYYNQRGEKVAVAASKIMRTPRAAALEKGKYAGIKKYRYSIGELEAIEKAYDDEIIRSSEVVYWDDVNVGQKMVPVVKGPLTSEDMLTFVQAVKPTLAFRRFRDYIKRHPQAALINPGTGMVDSPAASLIDNDVAHYFGFPFAHDTGIQRVAWLGNLVANWMGDDAFLSKLSVELRRPNLYGDTTWCYGEVADKYKVGPDNRVNCKLWCQNQRGEMTAEGMAEITLLSSDIKTSQGGKV